MSILDEHRLSFSQAADLVGVHTGTIVRWSTKGVRAIKLSTYVIGGVRVTSKERLEAFIAATTAAADGGMPAPESRTTREKDRAVSAAEKRVAAMVGE